MKKKFTTVRRFGNFIAELPKNETVLREWILANVPPLHDIRNTTRSYAISELYSLERVVEIARKQGYSFE